MERGRARSIRDIAHLYLSARESAPRRVVVAGADRACFPGFHVANLAAALARARYRVRVVEQSGLVVNAARFLALPPQVYASLAACPPSASAIDGVEVWFDAPPEATASPRTVDLVHVPPLEEPRALQRTAARWRDAVTAVFARRPLLPVALPGARLVLVAPPPDAAPPESWGGLAVVTRWQRSLGDPLPACVRDPASRLSRAYATCADRLVVSVHPEELHARASAALTRPARRAGAR